ncbi:MAG: hypothetical protein AABX30_01610 [Nanoarchaeota archaeon]
MLPLKHIVFGLVFALSLFLIFPKIGLIGFIIIFLSSVFIDIDHYIYTAVTNKDWNLKRIYDWHIQAHKKIIEMPKGERGEFFVVFAFLHGFEIIFILFILEFFVNKIFLFVVTGFLFHLTLDFYHQKTIMNRVDKISIIYDSLKSKKLKKIT